MSSLEVSLFVKPSRFFVFYGVVIFIIILIRIYQNYFFYRKTKLSYEEKLEPVLLGLEAQIE